ncbi:MAG: protein translocase subunit SecF [Deltaproteobacteria bacterium]|nr:protein translocase subunit SecF [Deltaproteobacteria bacterium]
MSFIRIIKKNSNFDFLGRQKVFLLLSLIVIVASLGSMFIRGMNYGIDFAGGVEMQLKFSKDPGIESVRQTLESSGFREASVQSFGEQDSHEYLILFKSKNLKKSDQTQTEEQALAEFSAKVTDVFAQKGAVDIRRMDMVGAKVGSDLKLAGLLSVLFSLILILIYIWFRFEYKYAPGAILALVHDVIVTMGVLSFLQKEFNLSIVAGLLTIVGYSINDTIVIFDRIRENVQSRGQDLFKDLVNKSVNETLSRTILTTLLTLFVVIAFFVDGGGIIHDFSLTLLVGMISGTYSTVFVASPVLLWIHNRQVKASSLSS